MASFEGILGTFPWWAWIPIISVIGWTVQSIVRMQHRHRERIEMIRQGMDPRDFGKR